MGPAAIAVWALDPHVIVEAVATDAKLIAETTSLGEAERIYIGAGRLPETMIARMVDFRRPSPS